MPVQPADGVVDVPGRDREHDRASDGTHLVRAAPGIGYGRLAILGRGAGGVANQHHAVSELRGSADSSGTDGPGRPSGRRGCCLPAARGRRQKRRNHNDDKPPAPTERVTARCRAHAAVPAHAATPAKAEEPVLGGGGPERR
ncbi:MAG: hypothetical protein NVS3B26_25250 [Mycobacteriales bacterium]